MGTRLASESVPTLGNREEGRGVGCDTGAGNMLVGDFRESFWLGGIDGGMVPLKLRSLVRGDLGRVVAGGGVRLEVFGLTGLDRMPLAVGPGRGGPGGGCVLRVGERMSVLWGELRGGSLMTPLRGDDNIVGLLWG